MTNPNNAIGTNGAFSGRTSPNALNDITGAFTKGITSGWVCSPKTGMTVQLGGSASVRDVALAEDNAGNKLTINNRSGAPVEVTLDGAPATNNRIDAIVAYVDNPSTGDDNTTDNPTACGIIAVKGTVAANPVEPTDAQIRSAITTDGATGGVAYYVVLATILVGTNVTTIGSGVITQGTASTTENVELADGSVNSSKINWSTTDGASGMTALTGSMTGTSWAQVSNCTFTTTKAGLYWIGMTFSSAYVGSNEFAIDARIVIDSQNYATSTQYSVKNWAGNYAANGSNSIIEWIPANKVVTMEARMNHYAGTVNGTMYYCKLF